MPESHAPVRWPQGDLAWLVAIGNVAADPVPLPAAGAGGLVESGQMALLGGSLVNSATTAATVTLYDGQSNNQAFIAQFTVPASSNYQLSLPRAGVVCEIGLFAVVTGGNVTGSLYVQHYWKYPYTPPGELPAVAREIRHFTVTVPASTPLATPATVALAMPVRQVTQVDWRVPKGPLGVMGFQLAMGGVKVQPLGDDWVIANGEHGTWHLHDQPDSGAWQLRGYNTGGHSHAVYLAFHVDLAVRVKPPPAPLPAVVFMPAPDLSHAGPPVKGCTCQS